jgi:CheY-like chemotaxis protein
MSNEPKPNKGELAPSINRSLALKKSGLVKRGIELINDLKKQQVRVLMCDDQKDFTDFFSTLINEATGNKYDLKIKSSPYADELLEFTENGTFDIFILILNNIIFPSGNFPDENCIKKALQFVTHLRETYQRPIIALAGWPDDPSLTEKAKLSGADFFFPLPFEPDAFMEAIEKCFDMLPGFDKVPRKRIKGRAGHTTT